MSNSSTAPATGTEEKRCGLFKKCHLSIPSLCITLQMVFVTILVGVLSYLLVKHFLVN